MERPEPTVRTPRYSTAVALSGTHTATNNTWVTIGWNVNSYDFGSMHDTGVNNTHLIAPEAGIYECWFNVVFPINATGIRAARIRDKNNTVIRHETKASASSIDFGSCSLFTTIDFNNAGDWIDIQAFQNSGNGLDLDTTLTHAGMRWEGPRA